MGSDRQQLVTPFGHRLLVVAPDPGVRDEMVARLGSEGYALKATGTGAEALCLVDEHHFDLIIVDIEIADLEELSHRRPPFAERPPILCVAPCESLDALIPELGVEVEDYVTKPCRAPELLARIQVLLHARQKRRGSVLQHGDLRLDGTVYRAWRGERLLGLTPAEYRLLRHLLQNAGRVLSKEQLAREVWGESRGDNAMERLVSRLRRKVDFRQPSLIRTRHGFGYWLGEGGPVVE
ncbi:response regulator transcription factor [Micromonospora echinospora]|uniref:response regulator transcription factor n=1 Tax=Micromonospora echinospora TaxID=1877 RepID=UPI0037B1AC95